MSGTRKLLAGNVLLGLALGLVVGSPSYGQYPFPSSHSHDSHSRGPDTSDRSAETVQRYIAYLEQCDLNHNGVIEPSELSGSRRYIVERIAQRVGQDPSAPMSLDRLREGLRNYYSQGSMYGTTSFSPYGTTTPTSTLSPSGSSPYSPSSGVQGTSADMGERQKQFAQTEYWLKHLDSNGNGIIEPDEINSGRNHKEIFDGLVQKVGIQPTVPMPVSRVREAVLNALHLPSNTPSGTQPGSSSGQNSPAQSAFLGFGVASVSLPPVPGFGPPTYTSTATVSASSSSSGRPPKGPPPPSSSSSSNSQVDPKVREYAASLLKQYDKNRDGVLKADEWVNMRGDIKAADTNRDGVVTVDELAVSLANYSRDRASGRHGEPSKSGPGTDSKGSGSSTARKSYRSLKPAERLSKDVPDWFLSKDADGDGQVTMSEYSSSWSDATVAEFAKYDLNNDGMVTVAECLGAAKAEAAKAAAAKAEAAKAAARAKSGRQLVSDRK